MAKNANHFLAATLTPSKSKPNVEKYFWCWHPNAPPELKCTKPVASGQEPTTATCWKSSYFWRLKRSRKMFRIIEDNKLGLGQELGGAGRSEVAAFCVLASGSRLTRSTF